MVQILSYGNDNNSLKIFLTISEINKILKGAHLIGVFKNIHYELILSVGESTIVLKNNLVTTNYTQLIFPIEILNELKTNEVLKNGILKYYISDKGKFYIDIHILNK